MSTTVLVFLCVATLILVGAASVVAAAETAFTRVSRSRADALVAAEAEDHQDDDDADDRVEEFQGFSRRPLTMLTSLTFVQLSLQFAAAALMFTIGREIGGRAGGYIAVAICLFVLLSAVGLSRSRALLAPDATAVGLVPILKAVAPLGVFTGVIVRAARRSSSA
ncbi:MAG: hypothetical protein HOK58_12945, partial [Acidimicrobiaceae bacterium]|nr:hypothetical protein [Acidimicrobiaceae bacterium]